MLKALLPVVHFRRDSFGSLVMFAAMRRSLVARPAICKLNGMTFCDSRRSPFPRLADQSMVPQGLRR